MFSTATSSRIFRRVISRRTKLLEVHFRDLPIHSAVDNLLVHKTFSATHSTLGNAESETSKASGLRVSTLFTGLLIVGALATTYGLYDFYNTLTMWPPEVRADLRAGLKARNQGNWELSERYLRRAWETSKALPATTLQPNTYLKSTGIAITLADLLESRNLPQKAYEVYLDAFSHITSSSKSPKEALGHPLIDYQASGESISTEQKDRLILSGEERVRAVALASKLGTIAEEYQLAEEEEKWKVRAVEEALKVVRDAQPSLDPSGRSEDEGNRIMLADLALPSWVDKTDLGAPLENLGAFYARVGKVEFAIPLYLQAISLLVPAPGRGRSSPEDRCRGAQLMSNLSELLIRDRPTPENLQQAETWTRKALLVMDYTDIPTTKNSTSLKGRITGNDVCDCALAAIYFNSGSLREMANDTKGARGFFELALAQSKGTGMREGVLEAKVALRRLDRLERATERDGE